MSIQPSPAIGSDIGRYRVEAVLGRGGMGVVYRATDARLGRKVALKVLPARYGDDPTFRARFLRESRLAASIEHRGVIPIYEAGDADGQLYLAMRYVEGTDLAELLRREGALDPHAHWRSSLNWPRHWTPRMRAGSCTGTSSRRTRSWLPRATPSRSTLPTSG